MRIAVFVGPFPKVSETFIVRQTTGLLDLGHEVDIYAEMRPEEESPVQPAVIEYGLLSRTTYMDIPLESGYWELPVWPILGRTWAPGSETSILNLARIIRAAPKALRCVTIAPRLTRRVLMPSEYGYQAQSLSTLYRLATLCARNRTYDVLHAHFGPVGNNFRFARTLWQAPLVVSFHGYDFSTWPRTKGAGVYRHLFDSADAVTVNSAFTESKLRDLGCPSSKLRRLPVGLDPDEFPFSARVLVPGTPVRILTIARLVEIKGHEYVIRAVAKVRERHPNVRYDIVGDGPLRPRLESLVVDLGLDDIVTFYGAQTSEEIRDLMAASNLFVLASVTVNGDQEGQGLVIQEAQASGLPVIATEHGPFAEGLLPGHSGFLVPERDVAALADRLTDLIAHPETWSELGRKGREYVMERFDIRRLNLELVSVYEDALRSFGNSGQAVTRWTLGGTVDGR
jgi:colanic acid/amylovoran biosynthesis glycosyltransferase